MEDDRLHELFEAIGPITIRRLFGGKGIYCGEAIVAIVYHDDLLLKADDETVAAFEAAGSRQWTYKSARATRATAMPYWTLPDEAYDDPDVMAEWARRALEAGLRTARQKTIRPSRRSS